MLILEFDNIWNSSQLKNVIVAQTNICMSVGSFCNIYICDRSIVVNCL